MTRFIVLAVLIWSVAAQAFADPPTAELIEVTKIWDRAPHSAFSDLICWRDRFVCAFRDGRGHVSADGKIRVLTSADADAWQAAAVIELAGHDLRDASLSITPDDRLMLIGGAAPRPKDGDRAPTGTFVAFSEDGTNWMPPKIIVPPGRWLWRVTWREGKVYGVSYATPEGRPFTALLASDDGTHFRALVPQWLGEGYPTEAVLRFGDDGVIVCLQRRDGAAPDNSAYIGISKPPYSEWQWHDLKIHLGGPNLIRIPSGRWIAAGRIHRDDGPKTELAWLDVEQKSLQPILQLPSGGDTSYPGLVWHDGMLWVSYYSSHEGKACIYLAKVQIE